MKKLIFLPFLLMNIISLMAQTYVDVTPTAFTGLSIDIHCSSASGDINNDENIDIIVTGRDNISGNHLIWIFLGDGNGGFTQSTNSGIQWGLNYSSINLGDYDGDGYLDIVTQGWEWDPVALTNTQRAYVFHNNGSSNPGHFTKAATLGGRSNGTIEFGDYDNDGKLDILQTGWDQALKSGAGDGHTTIYHNDGNNVFRDINNTSVFNFADGQARFGDLNNDGKLDIIINGWMQSHIYTGDGLGNFVDAQVTLPGYDWSYVKCIDYDKDGKTDILIGGHYWNNGDFYETKVFRGTGTNAYNFTEMNFGLTKVHRGPIQLGDCNGDGKTDFFISGWGGVGIFQILKNDGTNNAFSVVANINDIISGWADGTLEVKDFNHDGKDEVFKCGWGLTRLYKNTDAVVTNIDQSKISKINITAFENSIKINNIDSKMTLCKIEVFNAIGKSVSKLISDQSSIIIPNINNGIYVVRVESGIESKTTKLIIQ